MRISLIWLREVGGEINTPTAGSQAVVKGSAHVRFMLSKPGNFCRPIGITVPVRYANVSVSI
jgi:hypothetical protein